MGGKNLPDIRYKAPGRQVALAVQVVFPMSLWVDRPSNVQALGEVRRVIEQLRQSAQETEFPGSHLEILDLDPVEGRESSTLTFQQKSAREVCLQFSFAVALNLDEADDFWSHAAAIATATDFLQAFALRPHEKGVEIEIQQGRTIDPKAKAPAVGPVALAES